jgi:hypothetical protein
VEWDADCNGDGIVDYGQCHNGTLPDYNGNNIPDCCERGEACVVGSYPVQWRVEDGGNGHWYGTLPGTGGNWYARAIEAEQKGGYLATVSDAAEFAFVQRVSPWIYYLGGYRIDPVPPNDPTDGWRWVTGEPFPYSLRCTGWYPDSERWITAAAWQDCLGESDNSGPPYYYMVEWSADCNNDGTVDYGQILRGELPDINHNGTPDTCECIGDIYVDHAINGADLGALLAYWGPVTSSAASRACDLNGDGLVNGSDLGILLAYWGTCGN